MARPLGVEGHLGSYTYLLVDERADSTFCVGKGNASRSLKHMTGVRHKAADGKGDDTKLCTNREIEPGGKVGRIAILRHGLTPDEESPQESAEIDFKRLDAFANCVRGHHFLAVRLTATAGPDARLGAKTVTMNRSDRASNQKHRLKHWRDSTTPEGLVTIRP